MLESSRRSAINTSELGLYSDRGDRYHRSRYGLIARKLAIGVMVVVTMVLVAIFMYDFTSATSGNSKLNQETKHIYILQNALKKSANLSKKPIANSTISPSESGVNRTDLLSLEDRSDNANDEDPAQRNAAADLMPAETRVVKTNEPESRAQNLHNFKQRKRVLKSVEDAKENEEPEAKQLFDNHAIVYRVRQRYKISDSDEETSTEEARPTPFHWEFKTPHPTSFKRPRYPQLSHASRSIQDIIKYLTDDAERPHRGIKFTGVYMNPKKYDQISDISEMMSNNDKSEVDESSYPITYSNDPFYQYKPKHPADVNLLATSNVRFSPSGIHRYSPYYDSVYTRPLFTYNKPVLEETQYETVGSYSTNNPAKNRKPKPFSVMLDIYPITDIMEQNKKTSWPRPQQGSTNDHGNDFGKPLQYPRGGPKFYASASQPPIPLVAVPSPTTLPEEEERQQMIFHLNLYPRKKNKLSRYDIIHRSESMGAEERQQFAKRIMSPLESIAKHLTDHSAIEESKLDEAISLPLTRYHEISLDEDKDEKDINLALDKNSDADEDGGVEENITVPSNHKLSDDEDYASAERYESDGQETMKPVEKDCANCDSAMMVVDNSKFNAKKVPKDIDAVEGFQRFSDGLLRPH